MSFVVSIPLGMVFGVVTWAALRGRGGLAGLILFTFFGSMGSLLGGLAAQAAFGWVSEGVLAVGAVAGATLATLTEVVAFGRAPRVG